MREDIWRRTRSNDEKAKAVFVGPREAVGSSRRRRRQMGSSQSSQIRSSAQRERIELSPVDGPKKKSGATGPDQSQPQHPGAHAVASSTSLPRVGKAALRGRERMERRQSRGDVFSVLQYVVVCSVAEAGEAGTAGRLIAAQRAAACTMMLLWESPQLQTPNEPRRRDPCSGAFPQEPSAIRPTGKNGAPLLALAHPTCRPPSSCPNTAKKNVRRNNRFAALAIRHFRRRPPPATPTPTRPARPLLCHCPPSIRPRLLPQPHGAQHFNTPLCSAFSLLYSRLTSPSFPSRTHAHTHSFHPTLPSRASSTHIHRGSCLPQSSRISSAQVR